jgi:hypothetical protein
MMSIMPAAWDHQKVERQTTFPLSQQESEVAGAACENRRVKLQHESIEVGINQGRAKVAASSSCTM